MSDPARKRLGLWAAGLLLGLSLPARSPAADARPARPMVAGFERFAADPKTEPVEAGLLLLGELGCTSCHRAEPGFAAHLDRKQAPVLDGVGSRVRPSHLRAFLAAPHATKPGTTMPDVLAGLGDRERGDAVEALTHFLGSTGSLPHARLDRKAVAAGKTLYQQVGCVACHGAAPSGGKVGPDAEPVPLGPLEAKYSIPALAAFLLDPLKARPSGRMPGMLLKPEEANQVAQFLLRDLKGESRPNLEYRYYELDASPDKLPDFTKLKPRSAGHCDGFDVSIGARRDNIALRFEGRLRVIRDAQFSFITTSDDGSKLFVDDNLVVDNDGTHPAQEKRGSYKLGTGWHTITVDFFNAAGDITLDVEVESPGLGRQPLSGFLRPKQDGPGKPRADPERFTVRPELAAKGRDLFARVGCASCHQLNTENKPVESATQAPPLAALSAGKGCLADHPDGKAPRFDLSDRQRAALAAALKSVTTLAARRPTNAETITRTLTTFNCYACHQRDGRGGVQEALNDSFATTQKEMGDEGRLPPLLTGVGAKLNEAYLKQVVDAGAKDRPYMLTRMPRFGGGTAPLVAALTAVDHVEPVAEPSFEESPRRVKSDGRFLVGGMALGCIKCHTFRGVQAEGIQAIDMTTMTRRLRRDWFHRYVVNPPAFRPGTRMPTGWPDGKSMLPKVLGGDTVRQVEAVWRFLSDGPTASEPSGLGREPMPLFVLSEPVVYRNFILGGGPRAIGVGYPEKVNLAFDANDLRIALIWQGGFMDASRHWVGRGDGFQPPMGDNPVALPDGVPFARLASPTTPWPSRHSRELGYHFRGYRLGPERRPTFLYDIDTARVEDRPEGVAGPKAPGLKRTLTLTSDAPPDDLYFRVAAGESVKPLEGGWFLVNGEWKVRIESAAGPIVRPSGGKQELLVPVKFAGKTATVVEHFDW